ncbi:hypothetical protein BGZ95_001938 [Linnemannia exigua]|uniref:Uncharacterized protein n=1 Tax=Linnemannia exigua TaxID=604196 RepID=A0AAD4DLX8_9FUNG|nr:hypothetical protein BGZ95_001938 [Linnemannia exigua]
MTTPGTHITTTSTTTTTTKPTAMEKVREKATQLADKLSGRTHDTNVYHDSNQPGPGFHGNIANPTDPVATYHAGQQPIDALHSDDTRHPHHHRDNNNQTTMPLHTGAAVGDAAVPHGNTVNRAAYQQKLDHNDPLAAGAVGSGPSGPAVPPKDDHSHRHHGFFGHHDKHDQHDQHHTTALAGANAVDPNLIHPSIVPHPQTAALGGSGGGVAGPTGTSHMPTYTTQTNAPTAAGIAAPVAPKTAEQGVYPSTAGTGTTGMGIHHDLHNMNHVHAQTATMPTTTTAAGTQIPMNANNSTFPVNQHNMHQANPVHSINNNTAAPVANVDANNSGIAPTVPAMGAPGTTTAAGTHMPGQYVA